MKYIKTYEDNWSDYIWMDSENKSSPEGYKFQIGDYVKYNGKINKTWGQNEKKFDENSICIICVVNTKRPSNLQYCIVPIESTNSSYETWVNENDLVLAPEHEVDAIKYNL